MVTGIAQRLRLRASWELRSQVTVAGVSSSSLKRGCRGLGGRARPLRVLYASGASTSARLHFADRFRAGAGKRSGSGRRQGRVRRGRSLLSRRNSTPPTRRASRGSVCETRTLIFVAAPFRGHSLCRPAASPWRWRTLDGRKSFRPLARRARRSLQPSALRGNCDCLNFQRAAMHLAAHLLASIFTATLQNRPRFTGWRSDLLSKASCSEPTGMGSMYF